MKLKLIGIIAALLLMLATVGISVADGPIGIQTFNDGYDWMIQVPIRNPYDPDPCSGWLCGFLDAIGWPLR